MSIVGEIIDRSQFVETIDGLPFRLRIITAEVAARVVGNKVLGMMRAGTAKKDIPKEDVTRITEGYLAECMVSPKFGEESDAETDTICLRDLGPLADKVLTAVFKKSGFTELGKSSGSSKDTEAGS